MSNQNKLIGATLAAAAAFTFASAPVTSALANTDDASIQCFGVNSCKGSGSCKSSINSCKGKNSCKGNGFISVSQAQCDAMHGTSTPPSPPEPPARNN